MRKKGRVGGHSLVVREKRRERCTGFGGRRVSLLSGGSVWRKRETTLPGCRRRAHIGKHVTTGGGGARILKRGGGAVDKRDNAVESLDEISWGGRSTLFSGWGFDTHTNSRDEEGFRFGGNEKRACGGIQLPFCRLPF